MGKQVVTITDLTPKELQALAKRFDLSWRETIFSCDLQVEYFETFGIPNEQGKAERDAMSKDIKALKAKKREYIELLKILRKKVRNNATISEGDNLKDKK